MRRARYNPLQTLTHHFSLIDPEAQAHGVLPHGENAEDDMLDSGFYPNDPMQGSRTMGQSIAGHLDAAQCLNRAFASATPRKLAPGQRIWCDGEERSHVYLLKSGAICFTRMLPDGRRVVIGFALPGDLVGLGGDWHHCDAEAIQACRMEALTAQAFQRLAHMDAGFARLVRAEVGLALTDAQSHVVVVSRLTAAERVAHFLMMLSDRNRRRGMSPASVVLPMRRIDIGDFLGLTIETVSRTLTMFRKARLIDMEHPSVVFLKGIPALAKLASGAGADEGEVRRAA
jgi:CRP/FNR family transcriptional regulator, anaerobic regulatory protein